MAYGIYLHDAPPLTQHPHWLIPLCLPTRSGRERRHDWTMTGRVAVGVKDNLRATLGVATMSEVCRVWGAVEELRGQGRLEARSIKDRLR